MDRPNALRRGTVHELAGGQWLGFWPAALGLDLYLRTLRVRWRPPERELLEHPTGPRLILAWHNRSLIFPALVRGVPAGRVRVLISASRAAAWEAAYYAHRGLVPIRGSTTRGGSLAMREAIRIFRLGGDVALSPDGPSGPCYDVAPGAARLARREGVEVLVLGANQPRARRLRTWDRHLVPYPFQSLEGRIARVEASTLASAADDRTAGLLLREALRAVNAP